LGGVRFAEFLVPHSGDANLISFVPEYREDTIESAAKRCFGVEKPGFSLSGAPGHFKQKPGFCSRLTIESPNEGALLA
jgi:hypothetical protein